ARGASPRARRVHRARRDPGRAAGSEAAASRPAARAGCRASGAASGGGGTAREGGRAVTRSGTLATFATLAVIAASVPARAADTLLPYSDTVRQGLMAAAAGRVRVDPPALATAHTPALTVPAAFTDLARKPATVPWTELVLA